MRARKRRIIFLAIFLILTMVVTAGVNLYLQQRRAEVSARDAGGKVIPSSAAGLEIWQGMSPV